MKDIALLGIPYDEKSSFMKGAAEAPAKIRECLRSFSTNYFSENGLTIDNDSVCDKGDFVIDEYLGIKDIAEKLLSEKYRLLTLGGDHSISYPLIKAYAGFYKEIEILHIDAHADLYDELEGDKYSHACPFARIMENALATRLVQLGIRTLNTHQREQSQRFGTEIIEMKDFSIDNIPEFKRPVYVSIDMDGIDPAYAPGVSHHEPGGLSSREVINILHNINVPIIGADIVELNPHRDPTGITAALAAKLTKEILGIMLSEE